MEGAILTSAVSRWEGRDARGIPLVVWENELHLPLTRTGSTFSHPLGWALVLWGLGPNVGAQGSQFQELGSLCTGSGCS